MFSIIKIRTKFKAGEQTSISRNYCENCEKTDKKSDEQKRNPTGTNRTPKKGDQTWIEVLFAKFPRCLTQLLTRDR
jgi:hypothetical protein